MLHCAVGSTVRPADGGISNAYIYSDPCTVQRPLSKQVAGRLCSHVPQLARSLCFYAAVAVWLTYGAEDPGKTAAVTGLTNAGITVVTGSGSQNASELLCECFKEVSGLLKLCGPCLVPARHKNKAAHVQCR